MPWRASPQGAVSQVAWFEAGQGPAMVLLHGGGGTGKDWWYQLQHFGQRYRVIAPDLPGFGRSDWLAEVQSVADLPAFLAQFLRQVGVDTMVLGGNSMGGRVALAFAARWPELVSHLVLLDSVGLDLPTVPVRNPLAVPPDRFLELLVHDPAQYLRRTPYRTLEDAHALTRGRQSFARYLAASPVVADPAIAWDRLTMPALLIWGREDKVVPLAYGEALAQRLPRARLAVIEACGHLPHLEWPEQTNQTIEAFLGGAQNF
ncbi:MAG: alpha/beta fold hydrolase [Firmicutes bacterium]|nr:alpha/beta fold hydrolase [Bacillota bacterium]